MCLSQAGISLSVEESPQRDLQVNHPRSRHFKPYHDQEEICWGKRNKLGEGGKKKKKLALCEISCFRPTHL